MTLGVIDALEAKGVHNTGALNLGGSMTYLGKDGKQYVVIATGGTGYFNKSTADSVIAFAPP